MPDTILAKIRDYFGMTASQMMQEWKALDSKSKEQIKAGIADGTFTY